ncbi:MAG: hypothetical protein A4E58_00572 [Syntrophorhabdus sp. PtaB.Bin006]|nr:MAG: hypothetical protein A4E58_00572 [Syntrophorhabdus sp. PtaB.Bin006]
MTVEETRQDFKKLLTISIFCIDNRRQDKVNSIAIAGIHWQDRSGFPRAHARVLCELMSPVGIQRASASREGGSDGFAGGEGGDVSPFGRTPPS